jgi:hypothetical protein
MNLRKYSIKIMLTSCKYLIGSTSTTQLIKHYSKLQI